MTCLDHCLALSDWHLIRTSIQYRINIEISHTKDLPLIRLSSNGNHFLWEWHIYSLHFYLKYVWSGTKLDNGPLIIFLNVNFSFTGTIQTVPIGYISSCFSVKNGTPRQPTICGPSRATLQIQQSVFNNPEHSLVGLDNYSHVWYVLETGIGSQT